MPVGSAPLLVCPLGFSSFCVEKATRSGYKSSKKAQKSPSILLGFWAAKAYPSSADGVLCMADSGPREFFLGLEPKLTSAFPKLCFSLGVWGWVRTCQGYDQGVSENPHPGRPYLYHHSTEKTYFLVSLPAPFLPPFPSVWHCWASSLHLFFHLSFSQCIWPTPSTSISTQRTPNFSSSFILPQVLVLNSWTFGRYPPQNWHV